VTKPKGQRSRLAYAVRHGGKEDDMNVTANEAWGWAAGTGVLWALSYFFWRRLEGMPASA
jgi:hypothetical protein